MEMNQKSAPEPTQNLTPESSVPKDMDERQMIAEIHKFTKQTRNYMRWQIYITLVLVVLPLLALLFSLPFLVRSLEASAIAPMQGVQ